MTPAEQNAMRVFQELGMTETSGCALMLPGANGHVTEPIKWSAPQPIKSTLPAVEPFISELLPDVIGNYVMDVADRQQAPPDFVAVAAMCGIAAVVGTVSAFAQRSMTTGKSFRTCGAQ
jgi:hypothetical protein